MRNQFAGTCYRCGKRVEAGEGHFERITRKHREKGVKDPGRWRVQHAGCAITHRGTNHTHAQTAAGES